MKMENKLRKAIMKKGIFSKILRIVLEENEIIRILEKVYVIYFISIEFNIQRVFLTINAHMIYFFYFIFIGLRIQIVVTSITKIYTNS